jgi:hypothetical protein
MPILETALLIKFLLAAKGHAATTAISQGAQAASMHVSAALAHQAGHLIAVHGVGAATSAPTFAQGVTTLGAAGGLAYGVANQNGGVYRKVRRQLTKMQLQKSIQETVSEGDADEVTNLIHQGANVESTDEVGFALLHYAAVDGNYAVANALIANGAMVDVENHGITPLMIASFHGHTTMMKLLIDSGADIDFQSDIMGSALHAAAHGVEHEAVELLIERGADVNMCVKKCKTPFHAAVHKSSPLKKVLKVKGYSPKALIAIVDCASFDHTKVSFCPKCVGIAVINQSTKEGLITQEEKGLFYKKLGWGS